MARKKKPTTTTSGNTHQLKLEKTAVGDLLRKHMISYAWSGSLRLVARKLDSKQEVLDVAHNLRQEGLIEVEADLTAESTGGVDNYTIMFVGRHMHTFFRLIDTLTELGYNQDYTLFSWIGNPHNAHTTCPNGPMRITISVRNARVSLEIVRGKYLPTFKDKTLIAKYTANWRKPIE